MSRPNENRVKLTCYVQPLTMDRIGFLVDKTDPNQSTLGKVVDLLVGVEAGANVAGAGRKAPRGQHGRAKRKQSRAKRANDPKLSDGGGLACAVPDAPHEGGANK